MNSVRDVDSKDKTQKAKKDSCDHKSVPIVNSYNEWDLLEEVIVGRIEESIYPQQHFYMKGGIPSDLYNLLFFLGGKKRRPKKFFVEPAQKELDEFIHILEAEGVKVRRPEVINHGKKYKTPIWSSKGHTTACPRDCFLVIGNEIIESPMSWRNRYFERHAYYSLFKEYFDQGAKWTSAPKPPLRDSLYNYDYKNPVGERSEKDGFIINESEIVFDAADFARCGKDIFVTKSNATNDAGIEWLRRHLGDDYNVHVLLSRDPKALHIDTTFVPLAPGKALINPYYLNTKKLPSILKSWDLLVAPDPDIVKGGTLGGIFNEYTAMTSMWINMNGLMLDEKRVIIEASQVSMIKAFKDWGFETIPCNFLNFSPYGGTFHCATLDIRRRGKLESYF